VPLKPVWLRTCATETSCYVYSY